MIRHPQARASVKQFGQFLRSGVVSAVSGLREIFGNISSLRRIAFDSKRKNHFVAANGELEAFVVSAADRTVARHVYVKRKPFDFDKFEQLMDLLPDGHNRKILIDVGANIGTICIPAVNRGYFSNAIAVEPDPLNYSLLMANIHLNRLSGKITAYNVAAGEASQENVVFELSEENHGDHRIRYDTKAGTSGEPGRKHIEIEVDALDTLAGNLNPADALIWMDTQGYEGHALKGAPRLMRNGIPSCLEFWPYGLERSGGYDLLKKCLIKGSHTHFYDLEVPGPSQELTEENLDALYDKVGLGGRNTDILVFRK